MNRFAIFYKLRLLFVIFHLFCDDLIIIRLFDFIALVIFVILIFNLIVNFDVNLD